MEFWLLKLIWYSEMWFLAVNKYINTSFCYIDLYFLVKLTVIKIKLFRFMKPTNSKTIGFRRKKTDWLANVF